MATGRDEMDSYLLVKTVHVISSTVLFGTGLGIAFFFLGWPAFAGLVAVFWLMVAKLA